MKSILTYFIARGWAKTKRTKTYVLLLVGLLQIVSTAAYGQTVIKGKVVDEKTQEPLSGVTVLQKSTKNGVTTDANGAFEIKTRDALPVALSIILAGYNAQEVDVYDAEEPVTVSLSEENNYFDEVVVTGYTTQQRKAISGAITSVNFTEVNTHQADQDVAKLLQGKASGVQITSTSGTPGGGVTFIVRGNNSIGGSVAPLYVVDGVFMNASNAVGSSGGNLMSNALADINPADIENISILKDANATSIYGAQGANGVVLITTKRGKLNTPSRINFTVSHGWSEAVNRFKVTTGPETGQLLNESWTNTANDYGEELPDYLNRVKPAHYNLVYPDFPDRINSPQYASLPTYDRIDGLFQIANSSDYQVSVQGGNAASNHYIGVGYSSQESVVKPNTFERFSGRINYDNNVTRNLKLGTSFNINRTQRSNVRGNDNDPGGIINSAIFPRSFLPIYNDDGTYAAHATFNNHLRLIEHLDNDYVTWRNIVNLYGEYTFLPELKFRSSWSFDYVHNTTRSFSDFALSTNGSASSSSGLDLVYSAEQLLTYIKSFGRNGAHSVNAFLGNTINIRTSESVGASGSNYLFDQLKEVSSAATTSGSSSRSESRLVSFFGKAGYTYDDRYSFEFSLRADGSSRFGKNVRWGYFPAAGLTWSAGRESFVKNLKLFNDLKLRGSFGYAGNQNGIGNYDAIGVWSSSSQSYLDQASIAPGRLANPDLTWETTRQADFGIEFSTLKNRLNVDFDLYHKYTTNMLQSVTVPSRSGYSSATRNYGEMSNRGVELTIQSVNIQTKNFKWVTDFNISANRNKIEKIPQEQTLGATNRGTSILREGYPVNSFFLYKQLYVDPQTGNAVYDDVDKNDSITYADRQIVGKALPNFTGGLTNILTYGNFELNIFFYFTQGNDLLNMQDFFLLHGGTQNGIGFVPRQLDRWQKPGDVTDIPRLTTYNLNPTQNNGPANNYTGQVANLSSRYLDDGSFLRLKNISLSYTLPKSLVSKLHLNRVKATLSATNLWTLTRYKGVDPEVSAQSSDQNTAGYDWATVPQPRTFQVILNVTL
ncbi:MAG: TonB-dependent receptor [Prevotellaceae bacterium]|jgi:TonB-linked SusC/RagA family outer membrane protein|nr:TonB-dependent receptor [Prevotellaceae bacterium]